MSGATPRADTDASEPAPLAGVRVVDLSRILAGPFAAQLLADLGADVLKIEPPGGDPTRDWGPPFVTRADGSRGDSAYYACANRGKALEVLDLATAAGRAVLFERLGGADVLIENFKRASLAHLGLEPAALRARFPRLVIASIRAFAPDVEARDRAGYDFLIQAESGWMAITGDAAGPPQKAGVALADVICGLYAANAIQSALLRRARTGTGAHVEVPLFEAALAGLVNVASGALASGAEPRRFGNAHPNIVPYQSLRCADGDVALAVGGDAQFAALLEAFGRTDLLAAHPAWRTNPGRVAERDAVTAALEPMFAAREVADVLALCTGRGIPAGPVRSPLDVLLRQRGVLHRAVVEVEDDAGRRQEAVGTPILLDGRRMASRKGPPALPDGA